MAATNSSSASATASGSISSVGTTDIRALWDHVTIEENEALEEEALPKPIAINELQAALLKFPKFETVIMFVTLLCTRTFVSYHLTTLDLCLLL